MTAHEAIEEAQRRGIVLTPAGATLRFLGPKGALSEELKRELTRHKPEILNLLEEGRSTYPCSRCERFVFADPDIVCYWCRRAAEATHEA